MLSRCRWIAVAVLLGLLARAGDARIVEVNPYQVDGLAKDWKLDHGAEDYKAWYVDEDILHGTAKSSKPARAVFTGIAFKEFSLFFQVDKKQRNAMILLVPEGDGEPLEIWLPPGEATGSR
jgi:hypothetical protein